MKAEQYLAGIDEVGRGPLAGPLCVGACLIRKRYARKVLGFFRGVKECKQLRPAKRIFWVRRMKEAERGGAFASATFFVSHAVIDRDGLSRALSRAVKRCLTKLSAPPERTEVLLDGGLRAPRSYAFQKTIVRGDETETLIALASIAAKVRRDRYMSRLARRFPEYGFEAHKGYGTKRHYDALRKYGISPMHRVSFLKSFRQHTLSVTNLKINYRKSR